MPAYFIAYEPAELLVRECPFGVHVLKDAMGRPWTIFEALIASQFDRSFIETITAQCGGYAALLDDCEDLPAVHKRLQYATLPPVEPTMLRLAADGWEIRILEVLGAEPRCRVSITRMGTGFRFKAETRDAAIYAASQAVYTGAN